MKIFEPNLLGERGIPQAVLLGLLGVPTTSTIRWAPTQQSANYDALMGDKPLHEVVPILDHLIIPIMHIGTRSPIVQPNHDMDAPVSPTKCKTHKLTNICETQKLS